MAMTPNTRANIGVALAVAIWPLFILGIGLLLGHIWTLPAGAAPGDVQLHQNLGRFVLTASAASLMSATWFAGSSWTVARYRALLTAGICFLPAVAFLITNFTHR